LQLNYRNNKFQIYKFSLRFSKQFTLIFSYFLSLSHLPEILIPSYHPRNYQTACSLNYCLDSEKLISIFAPMFLYFCHICWFLIELIMCNVSLTDYSSALGRASAIFIGVYEPAKQKLLEIFPENLSALAHIVSWLS
jgi:uncharacterized membrane protein YhdT